MASQHSVVHLEISSNNPQVSDEFYGKVFGWKIEVDPRFDYHQFIPESGPAGAFVKVDDQTYKTGDIVIYISTDDIEATLAMVEANGGKTLLPKTEIPGVGYFAFFSDPTGNRLGLYTSGGQDLT